MPLEPAIRSLPHQVAERIAAKVVERPASVIKELIENSLDAGAQAISVEIHTGGLEWMRVSDDGTGMRRVDAPLALDRFATSKIQCAADLEHISTLGFRGEALSSIAAVARLELLTRAADELERACVRARSDPRCSPQVLPAASPLSTPRHLSLTAHEAERPRPALPILAKSPTDPLLPALLATLEQLRDCDPDTLREELALKAACTAAVKAGDYHRTNNRRCWTT